MNKKQLKEEIRKEVKKKLVKEGWSTPFGRGSQSQNHLQASKPFNEEEDPQNRFYAFAQAIKEGDKQNDAHETLPDPAEDKNVSKSLYDELSNETDKGGSTQDAYKTLPSTDSSSSKVQSDVDKLNKESSEGDIDQLLEVVFKEQENLIKEASSKMIYILFDLDFDTILGAYSTPDKAGEAREQREEELGDRISRKDELYIAWVPVDKDPTPQADLGY